MGKKPKTLIVSEVVRQSARTCRVGPIIASFQHAPFTSSLPNSVVETDITVPTWTGDKPNIQMELTTPHMTYTSVGKEGPIYHNTFIAIRNKKTGKTRLIEANETVLAASVEAPQTTNPLLLREPEKEQTKEERREAGKHLIKAFGQAKGQRFYEQQDRMKVEGGQLEEKISRAAEQVSEDKLSAGAPVADVAITPPCNRAAGRKEDVYRLSDLLTQHEISDLADAAETVLNQYNTLEALTNGVKSKQFSKFGVELLKKYLNTEEDVRQVSAIVLYMETIIKFSKLNPAQIKRGVKSLQDFIPLGIKKKVFDTFTTGPPNERYQSPEDQDRAICYIIVLALLATNYKLELNLLTESIKTRVDKLKKLITMTGASLQANSVTQQDSIVLRLPLATFEVNRTFKKKKK